MSAAAKCEYSVVRRSRMGWGPRPPKVVKTEARKSRPRAAQPVPCLSTLCFARDRRGSRRGDGRVHRDGHLAVSGGEDAVDLLARGGGGEEVADELFGLPTSQLN